MKRSLTIVFAASTIAAAGWGSNVLACNGGYGYRSYSAPQYPQYVERAYITIPPQMAPNGLPLNTQFNSNIRPNVVPAPTGLPTQGFAGGLPQGFPQGGQPGPQFGMPSMNGFAPQGQRVAQQPSNGMQQGAPLGPQGQAFPQQFAGNLPRDAQRELLPQPPTQGPVGPQAPEGNVTNNSSASQRIADDLMGLPGLPGGPPAGAGAGPIDRPMPSILIGSIMSINGQPLGENRGTVRLIVNGSPVQLEVLEWAASTAKVRIPGDLPANLQVQIEITRADGSIVTKDLVKLAAGQPMAAAK